MLLWSKFCMWYARAMHVYSAISSNYSMITCCKLKNADQLCKYVLRVKQFLPSLVWIQE